MENNKKIERSWIMYDWANSVYATIIMAAIFPIYFASNAPGGDVWWGYGTSIATFTVAVLAPFLGAIADYKGMKKRLFLVFLIVGVLFTSVMAIGDKWQLMLVGYIISYIGFTGSCLFYDSFLTDVTTPDRMDAVSAKGYAMGYIGGSTIPFIIAIVLNLTMEDAALAVKISVVMTSVWWLVFSIPFLKNVKQTHSLGPVPKHFAKNVLTNVGKTVVEIVRDKPVLLFMIAYFFYIDGVGTVIHMSTAYGATLGLGTVGMILALLVTQLVAAPCAILFSRFAKKIGSIKMIGIGIAIYCVVCLVGFYMGFSVEQAQKPLTEAYTASFTTDNNKVKSNLTSFKDDVVAVLTLDTADERVAALQEAADDHINYSEEALKRNPEALAEVKDIVNKVVAGVTATVSDQSFVEGYQSVVNRSQILFWCMAVLVGTSQGGIQALSRSFYGKLIPPEKSNEFYGFFDIFGRFAAVMGPAIYAFIRTVTGRSSFGILALLILFSIGGVVLIIGRNYFRSLEARNREAENIAAE